MNARVVLIGLWAALMAGVWIDSVLVKAVVTGIWSAFTLLCIYEEGKK